MRHPAGDVNASVLHEGVADAPPRFFDAAYAEHVTLRDGTSVELRRVRPDDKALLAAGFAALSNASRYARFLAPKTTLTGDELRYLTELDHVRHFAIGAIGSLEDGAAPVGLGVARFIVLAEPPHTAEAAIAVADQAQGRGLGRLLFLRLCAAAAERGVEQFRCEVLGSNTGMRALIEAIAPTRAIHVEGGVMTIDMTLPVVAPTLPLDSPPPEGAMYQLFRAAAENAVEWTAAVRRLWRDER